MLNIFAITGSIPLTQLDNSLGFFCETSRFFLTTLECGDSIGPNSLCVVVTDAYIGTNDLGNDREGCVGAGWNCPGVR